MTLDERLPFPKRPRLKNHSYAGVHLYFITISTHGRKKFFTPEYIRAKALSYVPEKTFDMALETLMETARLRKFKIHAYCFMPDHLHLLTEGLSEDSDLKSFINLFKQKSGYLFKQKYSEKLWHPSYYDHILRECESMETVAMYIWGNPVRKGMVEGHRGYPYSGPVEEM